MVGEYALSCFNVDKNAESFDDATFSDVDDDWGEEKDVRDDESGAGGGDAPSSFPASEMGNFFFLGGGKILILNLSLFLTDVLRWLFHEGTSEHWSSLKVIALDILSSLVLFVVKH